MRIDPVVILMDELETAQASLARARDHKDWRATRRQLAIIASLHTLLRETQPTTVIGAAHMLRQAAEHLGGASGPHEANRLRAIANRFDEGERALSDLIWLREAMRALARGEGGQSEEGATPLIRLALRGACRPVLLYRAVGVPPRESTPLQSKTGGQS